MSALQDLQMIAKRLGDGMSVRKDAFSTERRGGEVRIIYVITADRRVIYQGFFKQAEAFLLGMEEGRKERHDGGLASL